MSNLISACEVTTPNPVAGLQVGKYCDVKYKAESPMNHVKMWELPQENSIQANEGSRAHYIWKK